MVFVEIIYSGERETAQISLNNTGLIKNRVKAEICQKVMLIY